MDKKETKQINHGKGNTNINIDQLLITIEDGKEVNARVFFDSFVNALQNYDKYLIEQLGDKIIVNKTNKEEDFSASKILKSLLTIGMPLDAAFSVFENSITNLVKQHVEGKKFETKEIRKIVCESIQSCDLRNYAPSQIQIWSQKYVRKYGRNNQVVKIQYDNGSTTDISMEFLKQFVDDLILSISPNISAKKISSNSRKDIAECVLDFVNSCDVYIIRYEVLKSIILEIALQPPHPWFINETTKSSIINYDSKQIKVNLTKANNYFNNNVSIVPQSILMEIIHHASSMILSKYDFFLGCNDLSSLYLLESLMNELINTPYEDILFEEYPINKLLPDITKVGIEYESYFNLIKYISSKVNTSAINTVDFSRKVNEFGKFSLKIIENLSSIEFEKFFTEPWEKYTTQEVLNNIRLFMNIAFGNNEIKPKETEDKQNFFWYRLRKFKSNVFSEVKNNFFVFFGENKSNDLKAFERFKQQNVKMGCNLILIVSEEIDTCEFLRKLILKKLDESHCADGLVIINLDKEMLKEIYWSNNPPKCFEDILLRNFLY